MDLHPDLIDLLMELQNSRAEYLVVGGWAVGVHAEPRYTKDLIEQVRTMKPDEFVFFGVQARIDLLRNIPGVIFDEAHARRKVVDWNGIALP